MDKDTLLKESLIQFYSNFSHFSTIKNIIEDHSVVSLRTLDWFVTNYSKTHMCYLLPDVLPSTLIHQSYKNQLKAYYKRYFDPFRRHERVFLCHDGLDAQLLTDAPNESVYVITTLGQMNFFRWVISHHILEYVTIHIQAIEQDMNKNAQTDIKNVIAYVQKNSNSI